MDGSDRGRYGDGCEVCASVEGMLFDLPDTLFHRDRYEAGTFGEGIVADCGDRRGNRDRCQPRFVGK